MTRILLVDDKRTNLALLEIMLATEPFEIITATSGSEVFAIVERTPPDLILLDVKMPDMDGYQVAAALKANPDSEHIPIIIVTELDDRAAKMRGLTAGAEDFLSKPVDRAELLMRVRNLLRLKHYADYHRENGLMNEERYRQIVQSTSDAIIRFAPDTLINFANRRCAEMLGYPVEEIVGQSVFAFVEPSERAVVEAALVRRKQGASDTYDVTLVRKDGTHVSTSASNTPLFDSDGVFTGALSSLRDVTEQKKLMAQLIVSDRMASVGTLAAGVAHEINNPLAVIIANLYYLKTHPPESETIEPLDDAYEAADRLRLIVRDLRIFARSEADKSEAVDLQRVMESTLRMAWNEIRHRARLVKVYGATPLVQANESRLGQVFLNLVVNAAQAIPEGHFQENEIRVTTSTDGEGRAVVEIHDTGPGIPAHVKQRLFTPFFTTKAPGVGTGLGLSICQRLVHEVGGTISVESTVGKGTVFRVVLLPAGPIAALAPEPAAAAPHHGARILVIDDEHAVGTALQRNLTPQHTVTAVTSAREALALLTSGERFDVIFCDLMMPEMTGMELHTALRDVVPEQVAAMVFVSGGAFTPGAREFLAAVGNARIDKPFDMDAVAALVAARLQSK